MLIGYLTSWFMAEIWRSSYFKNHSWNGAQNIATFSGRIMIWVHEVIGHKKLVALLLVPEY